MSGGHVIRNGGVSGAPIVSEAGSEDPFEITFAPAKPVLDAIIEMWKPLAWLDRQRRSRLPLFDPERAAELIDLIPSGGRIAKAGTLFLEAEEISAPEAWVHVAVGLMLQSEANPNAIDGDAYRCAITDGAFRDPEVWEPYDAGFSAAVVVRSIRQARRQGALPSPGGFLKLCAKHREQFKKWNADTSTLLEIRWAAEDVLDQIGPKWLDYYDPEEEVPF
jgi:hypothetical protein